jgi:2-methylisocitrate lyase-like PEP mutase family enzyme
MTTSLRSRLTEHGAVVALGAHDGLTARIAERAGVEALYHGGYALAAHHFGLPDVGLVGRAEVVESVRRMRAATDLPIIVDADTGYGSEAGAWLTTRELEAVGANAVQIEDQVSPKRCGHFEGKEVISAAEMAGKLKAAVDTRNSEEFLVIARTDARAIEGLEAAIARAQIYAEAGADLTFVEAPVSAKELAEIPRRLPVPQVANMVVGGKTPLASQQELAAMGFGLVLYANAALQASVLAIQEVLAALRQDGSLARVEHRLVSFAERQRLVGKGDWDALEARFSPTVTDKR